MNSIVWNYSEKYTNLQDMSYCESYCHDVENLYTEALGVLLYKLKLDLDSPEVRSLLEASCRCSSGTISMVIWDDVN